MRAIDLPRPVGFVLGAGGSQGAVQVGMLQALSEVAVRPDLVVGTSVGSLNGAVVAADPRTAANRLSHIWPRTTRAPEVYLPGPEIHRVSPAEFDHAGILIEGGYRAAKTFLQDLHVAGPGLYGPVSPSSQSVSA